MENAAANENAPTESERQALANDHEGYSKLHLAAEKGNLKKVRKLIKRGRNLDTAVPTGPTKGSTALHIATKFRHSNVIALLLEKGADFTLENVDNETPLHIACRELDGKAIDLLLRAYYTACSKLNENIKKTLAEINIPIDVNMNLKDNFLEKFKPLHFAVKFQLIEMAALLVNNGIGVKATDSNGMTALHWAVQELSKDQFRCSLSWTDDDDTSIKKLAKIIDLLVHHGCDVNIADNFGRTPVFYLYKEDKVLPHLLRAHFVEMREIVIRQLLSNSADLTAVDHEGDTILHAMAKSTHGFLGTELQLIFDEFCRREGDVNAVNRAGCTPLHYVCERNNVLMAKAFLEYGSDVNAVNADGDTPYTILRKLRSMEEFYSLFMFLHLKGLAILGLPLSQPNREIYDSDSAKLNKYNKPDFFGCLKGSFIAAEELYVAEVERMRSLYIDRYTTLYDIVHKDTCDLVYHLSNERLMGIDLTVNYPIYGYLVRIKVNSAKRRAVLLEPAKASLASIFKLDMPEPCVHRILSYLEINDLKNLTGCETRGKESAMPTSAFR